MFSHWRYASKTFRNKKHKAFCIYPKGLQIGTYDANAKLIKTIPYATIRNGVMEVKP
jgi:chloramphenicol O-acetyltransferase